MRHTSSRKEGNICIALFCLSSAENAPCVSNDTTSNTQLLRCEGFLGGKTEIGLSDLSTEVNKFSKVQFKNVKCKLDHEELV